MPGAVPLQTMALLLSGTSHIGNGDHWAKCLGKHRNREFIVKGASGQTRSQLRKLISNLWNHTGAGTEGDYFHTTHTGKSVASVDLVPKYHYILGKSGSEKISGCHLFQPLAQSKANYKAKWGFWGLYHKSQCTYILVVCMFTRTKLPVSQFKVCPEKQSGLKMAWRNSVILMTLPYITSPTCTTFWGSFEGYFCKQLLYSFLLFFR